MRPSKVVAFLLAGSPMATSVLTAFLFYLGMITWHAKFIPAIFLSIAVYSLVFYICDALRSIVISLDMIEKKSGERPDISPLK